MRVPINLEEPNQDEENGDVEMWECRPQVTSWCKFREGPRAGIHAEIHYTPGEYYKEPSGRWNRRYGGEYEIITLSLRDLNSTETREFFELDYFTRAYGSYNRQKVNGRWQWVRLDSHEDFLNIDQTFVQEIEPVTSDRYLEPVDTVFECAGQALVFNPPTAAELEAEETQRAQQFYDLRNKIIAQITEEQGPEAGAAALAAAAAADQRAEEEEEERRRELEETAEALSVLHNCTHEFVWDRYETGLDEPMGSVCYCSKCGLLSSV